MASVLQREEIRAITGKKLLPAQCRALSFMKIPYVLRPDGSPCVAKEAANQCLGVQSNENKEPSIIIDLESL